jgi:peroxiredoxin
LIKANVETCPALVTIQLFNLKVILASIFKLRGQKMEWIQRKLRRVQPGGGGYELAPGMPAPDFSLPGSGGDEIRLRDLRGRPVILAFYPADWSPVCSDQMALYNEVLDMFAEYDAQLLGISVDGKWCHKAFAEAKKLRFPLLSDFEPKGKIARQYGVYHDEKGTCRRALCVLEDTGLVYWHYISPNDVNPGADGILEALERMKDDREGIA